MEVDEGEVEESDDVESSGLVAVTEFQSTAPRPLKLGSSSESNDSSCGRCVQSPADRPGTLGKSLSKYSSRRASKPPLHIGC